VCIHIYTSGLAHIILGLKKNVIETQGLVHGAVESVTLVLYALYVSSEGRVFEFIVNSKRLHSMLIMSLWRDYSLKLSSFIFSFTFGKSTTTVPHLAFGVWRRKQSNVHMWPPVLICQWSRSTKVQFINEAAQQYVKKDSLCIKTGCACARSSAWEMYVEREEVDNPVHASPNMSNAFFIYSSGEPGSLKKTVVVFDLF